ncbi:MAG: hypothetical protein V2I51_20755 [Anderseniella sp.]|nr:hypothetical protein [Anderseniella sp.]
MRTVCKVITGIYVMLCLGALAVIPLNAAGMFGEPDPLSGVFAVILAMPWMHIFTNIVGDAGGNAAAGFIMAGAGMGLNAAILWGLCSWVAKKIAQRTG